MNKFKIVEKPEETNFPRRAKYTELVLALKNLASDKSICLGPSEMKELGFTTKIAGLRAIVNKNAKKLGFEAWVIEKNGSFYFFNK